MPSPTCQVKDGAGAYQATTNGVNVTPTNTITINLVSSAGVSTWSISCITTDETSDAAAVTASLVIDSVAKTATFTAPSAGKAYRFQSQINGGVDANGVSQASYTTTFGVYTLTAGSRRVHAVDETFESHQTFGWVGDINSVIRNPAATTPTGTGFRHVTADIEDAASKKVDLTDTADVTAPSGTGFVVTTAGAIDAATLAFPLAANKGGTGVSSLGAGVATFLGTPSSANLATAVTDETGSGALVFGTSPTITTATLATPTLTGAITISSYTSTTTTSADGKVVVVDSIGSVQTTDDTVTSAYTSGTLTDEAVHSLEAIVTAIKSDGTAAACYKRHYAGRRDGGSWTQLATASDDTTEETTSSWDCTVDVSSNTFRVRVTGVAANTIRWGFSVRIQSTVP